tara:strand:+ start:206 stop:631 length:426 start_codon:yes stop_codon:yes gene_type:complete
MSEDKGNLSEIVSRHSVEIAGLASDVRSLIGMGKDTQSAVAKLADNFDKRAQPDKALWIQFLMLMAALLGGGYTIVQGQIQNHSALLQAQINASNEERNIQYAASARVTALLWNASSLGVNSKWPEGPYYFPTITGPTGAK